jgi:ATP-independent RNA helicase DbpA
VTFEQLINNKAMIENLKNLGFKNPTTIQKEAIPIILQKKDLLALAKTGSGKTFSFGIPLLIDLDSKKEISSLIIAPTRELANQIANELKKLAKFKPNIKILTLTGGSPMRVQANSLRHGANIIIATPGRILAHLKESNLNLEKIKTIVLDEADRMLDMGFLEDIEKILNFTPRKKQTLLFSATFSEEILNLSKSIQQDREVIKLEDEKPNIKEIFIPFDNENLLRTILHFKPTKAIIFCNTKLKCQEIEDYLISLGFDALSIHSDLEQFQRDETLIEFIHQSINFLIATDIASRGLDIDDVDLIINYDLPRTKEVYTHRVGRSARMDKKGVAISFVKSEDEEYFDNIDENFNFIKNAQKPYASKFVTFCISGGKKQKLRKADILGSFINEKKLSLDMIGKITINPTYSYISIKKDFSAKITEHIKIKKRNYRLWKL